MPGRARAQKRLGRGQLGWILLAGWLFTLSTVAAADTFSPGASTSADGEGADGRVLNVGSKKFTESVILGELLTIALRQEGFEARHRRELGGTRVVWNALLDGEIDAYVEYSGTLEQEIFAGQELSLASGLEQALGDLGVLNAGELGFDNTYALGIPEPLADRLGLETISQLAEHPDLSLGFSNELMDRADGWPSLKQTYALPHRNVRGLDHDLAYRGLEAGDIQIVDLYSTDAEISYYGLRILRDDRAHFPAYRALVLHRADLPTPAREALARLVGQINEPAMVAMNARAKLDQVPEGEVAGDFARQHLGIDAQVETETRLDRLWRHTLEHLQLVALSLALAIVLALPLGIAAARYRRMGQAILAFVGLLQTIPALALLVFMIPFLGIGAPPALMALFLYSLLPIVRNTHAGLVGIDPEIQASAKALGLPSKARLWRVELPLASPAILAGIKTAAVINIGTATLGALVGAGGYGQPILTGIRLDNLGLILEGAIPAALLALLAQGLFELVERWVVPRGLRLEN